MTDDLKKDLGTIGTADVSVRTKEQFASMQRAIENKECPFCPPYNFKHKPFAIGEKWYAKKNDMPYEDHDHHFVIALHPHTNDVLDVPSIAWVELQNHLQRIVSANGIRGGAFVMRFGLSDHNASTIRHLHAHIQVPALSVILENKKLLLLSIAHQENKTCFAPIGWRVIQRKEFWTIREKQILPKGYLGRYIIHYNEPVADMLYLTPYEWKKLFETFQQLVKSKSLPGGGIVIPFGSSFFNNRITRRPYMEIFVPRGPDMNVRAIFVPDVYRCAATFSKDPSRKKIRKKRLEEFQK